MMEFLEVYDRYKPELGEVERILYQSVESRDAVLREASIQLLQAGGKRIRPLFALLCGRFGDGDRARVHRVAAAMELLHMATLVHDDVIDDASLRRGRPTVRAQYGIQTAMYTGDFLFAQAISLMGSLSNPSAHIRASKAIVRMCQGELDQIADFYNVRQSFRQYFRRVQRKTALLMELSCSLGAAAADAPAEITRLLGRFGRFTGMAFQVVDDILDFTGDEVVVGKKVGSDLRQGNLTLPVLYALHCSPRGHQVRSLIHRNMSPRDIELVVDAVLATDAVPVSQQTANRYMEKALSAISALGDSRVVDELVCVAEFVNQRAY